MAPWDITVPVNFGLRLNPKTMAWLATTAIQRDLENVGEAALTYSVSQAFVVCFHDPDLLPEMFRVGLLGGYAVTPLWGQLPAGEADAEFAPHIAAALAQIGDGDGHLA